MARSIIGFEAEIGCVCSKRDKVKVKRRMRLCLVMWLSVCVALGREGEGRGVAVLSRWLLQCVVKQKEVSSRLMWVRVKIEQWSWVFIPAYGPGSEKSEEEIGFRNELNDSVGNFGRKNLVVLLRDLNA